MLIIISIRIDLLLNTVNNYVRFVALLDFCPIFIEAIQIFTTLLRYKSEWYGRALVTADRYYPSTKICHVCGYKNKTLQLSHRRWQCPECGIRHDRDINASINLRNIGLSRVGTTRINACGECHDGGMGKTSVYELSPVEAGSLAFYKAG